MSTNHYDTVRHLEQLITELEHSLDTARGALKAALTSDYLTTPRPSWSTLILRALSDLSKPATISEIIGNIKARGVFISKHERICITVELARQTKKGRIRRVAYGVYTLLDKEVNND